MSKKATRVSTTPPSIWRFTKPLILLVAGLLLSGCSTVDFNYKRFAYDLLRQDDCRRNDIDPFCARTFVFEYDEYIQMRQAYMQESENGLMPDRVASPTDFNRPLTFLPARNQY